MADVMEEKAEEKLKESYEEAKNILEDKDKAEQFLQQLERKLEVIPIAGDKLSEIPVMASLVRSYFKKEYTTIPLGSIIAIIGALTYFISPIDIIPDAVPVAGYTDDAFVAVACLKLVESDINDYKKWRCDNGKTLVF